MMHNLVTKHLGMVEFIPTWQAMQEFTARRDGNTPDELWLLEHPPVYTLGLNGRPEHLLREPGIPIVKTDRGGQITYHGPGQIVAYLLLDLKRRGFGVRELVSRMEAAVIDLLQDHGVNGESRRNAPGVYVEGKKIAAVGLRIKRGCSYHGLSLNVDMELNPFSAINPCGYPGLEVTRIKDLGIADSIETVGVHLSAALTRNLNT